MNDLVNDEEQLSQHDIRTDVLIKILKSSEIHHRPKNLFIFQKIHETCFENLFRGIGMEIKDKEEIQEYMGKITHYFLVYYKKYVNPQIIYKMINLLECGGFFHIKHVLNMIKQSTGAFYNISESYLHGLMLYPLPNNTTDVSFQIYMFTRINSDELIRWILPCCTKNKNFDYYLKISILHCIKHDKELILQTLTTYYNDR